MKKLIFTNLFLSLFVLSLSAQNFVSTTAENKNVVLEEFTGIYCQFCPDGHVIASQIASSNPGDVFLINVHAGGFANPSGGDPDFRTQFGDALDQQSQLAGYPAGTINRRNFPGDEQQGSPSGATAMSRGQWAANATTVLGEASSVNVAAQASVDAITRELKVVVETYYTANAAASTHKLNVALLQNNVAGPQTGAATYNPGQILPSGDYNHQHMLRHLLTGQWGQDITTTTMGHFQADTLTYTLPGDINGVGLELADLEVVVFIAEGQQTILTGNAASVTVNIPAGFTEGDLSVSGLGAAPTDYCNPSFTPIADVRNEGNSQIDAYEVSYSINGGTPVSQTINTTLMPGASSVIPFSSITIGPNETIDYEVEFVSLNANTIELSTGNNTAFDGPYTLLDPNFDHGTSLMADLESAGVFDDAPAGAIAENPDEIAAFIINQSAGTGLPVLGGFGNSANSFMWDFWSIQSGSSMIIFEEVDLSSSLDAILTFSHASAQYQTSEDQLEVMVSTDCGQNWTTLYDESGASLSTVPPLNNARFFPQSNEWTSDTLSLATVAGSSEVLVGLRGTSDYGNALYVDDINVTTTVFVNTNEVEEALSEVKVFPNPAFNNVNIQFNLEASSEMNINITNALGQMVKQVSTGNLDAGQHNFAVNTAELASGMYFINFNNGESVTTQRLVISK